MKIKLSTKIGGGYAILFILILGLGLYCYQISKSTYQDLEQIDILGQRVALENNIQNEFNSAVSSIRGFIAYGDNKFKEKYIKDIGRTIELEKELLKIAAEDKRGTVEELIKITTEYRDGVTNNLVPAVERQIGSKNMQEKELLYTEVVSIAGQYTPLVNSLTGIINEVVKKNIDQNDKYIDDSKNKAKDVQTKTITLLGAALVLSLILAITLTQAIRKPILQMIQGANKFAEGDFREQLNVRSSDEIGDLSRAFNDMASALKKLITDVSNNAQLLASNSEELAAAAEEVNATMEEISSASSEVAAAAEKSYENSNSAVQGSQNVERVAQEGNVTVKLTIEKINTIATSSIEVEKAIQHLEHLSIDIGKITNVIAGIADQTNLLALNAAIEAARAGDHGKGFAVVAEEVRKLAEQSANATKEINQLIGEVQTGVNRTQTAMEHGSKEVEEGVRLASEAGEALNNIISSIRESIVVIEHIQIGSKQSSEGMGQVASSNEQVTSTVQQISTATQELAAISNKLQISVEKFKV